MISFLDWYKVLINHHIFNMRKGPGKPHRDGISLIELTRKFPNDDAAREWFESVVWPDGPYCPHCGSYNVQSGAKHPQMTHRCRSCPKKPFFSLKTGNVMQGSNLGYQTWAIAIYLLTTNLKSVSSMKLHRDLDVTQKTAWHLAHRLRRAFADRGGSFWGPVEVDETYLGGKARNMSEARREKVDRIGGPKAAKAAVVGLKDRDTNQVYAQVVESAERKSLHPVIDDNVAIGATIYTDEHQSYKGTNFEHESVNHSAGQYVDGMVHMNGIESFWSMLKRGYMGTFHHFSKKHMDRYVNEFSGRHIIRELDTIHMMEFITLGMFGKRLRCRDLINKS